MVNAVYITWEATYLEFIKRTLAARANASFLTTRRLWHPETDQRFFRAPGGRPAALLSLGFLRYCTPQPSSLPPIALPSDGRLAHLPLLLLRSGQLTPHVPLHPSALRHMLGCSRTRSQLRAPHHESPTSRW